jgi:hypothetical protein
MSTEEYGRVELDDDERADVILTTNTLRAAGWQVYRETTMTDVTMIMEPAAGARYEAPGCGLQAEYVAQGLSIFVEELGDREDHVLLVHNCGLAASRRNRSLPNDDSEKLVNVLKVLTAHQDRLTAGTYAQFGRDLLAACDVIEYKGDDSGLLPFTQEDVEAGRLPTPSGDGNSFAPCGSGSAPAGASSALSGIVTSSSLRTANSARGRPEVRKYRMPSSLWFVSGDVNPRSAAQRRLPRAERR